MFLERLSKVSSRIEGAVALSLIAKDGIPIESFSSEPELDLEVLAAELISQVRLIGDDYDELDVGLVQHLSVTTDRLTLMVTAVADGYYLLLVLTEPSSRGRARYELRRARLLFEEDLV